MMLSKVDFKEVVDPEIAGEELISKDLSPVREMKPSPREPMVSPTFRRQLASVFDWISDTDDVKNECPDWFLNFMESYKDDLVAEITAKVVQSLGVVLDNKLSILNPVQGSSRAQEQTRRSRAQDQERRFRAQEQNRKERLKQIQQKKMETSKPSLQQEDLPGKIKMNQVLKSTDETVNKEALKLKRKKHTKHIMEITKGDERLREVSKRSEATREKMVKLASKLDKADIKDLTVENKGKKEMKKTKKVEAESVRGGRKDSIGHIEKSRCRKPRRSNRIKNKIEVGLAKRRVTNPTKSGPSSPSKLEKPGTVTQTHVTQIHVNYPVTKVTEYPVTQVKDYPITKVMEYPVTKVKEYPIIQVTEYPVSKVTEYPVSKVTEYPVSKVMEYPVTKVMEYPVTLVKEYPVSPIPEYPLIPEATRSSMKIVSEVCKKGVGLFPCYPTSPNASILTPIYFKRAEDNAENNRDLTVSYQVKVDSIYQTQVKIINFQPGRDRKLCLKLISASEGLTVLNPILPIFIKENMFAKDQSLLFSFQGAETAGLSECVYQVEDMSRGAIIKPSTKLTFRFLAKHDVAPSPGEIKEKEQELKKEKKREQGKAQHEEKEQKCQEEQEEQIEEKVVKNKEEKQEIKEVKQDQEGSEKEDDDDDEEEGSCDEDDDDDSCESSSGEEDEDESEEENDQFEKEEDEDEVFNDALDHVDLVYLVPAEEDSKDDYELLDFHTDTVDGAVCLTQDKLALLNLEEELLGVHDDQDLVHLHVRSPSRSTPDSSCGDGFERIDEHEPFIPIDELGVLVDITGKEIKNKQD